MSAASGRHPITDPIVLEDISAALALRVYEAARDAERQRAGLLPPPPGDRVARIILRRSRLHATVGLAR